MNARLAYSTAPRAKTGAKRRWFLDALKTLAWTVAITILIWAYADIEFTERRDVRATLRIHLASGDKVLLPTADLPANLFVDPRTIDLSVDFTVEGNRSTIDRLVERIGAQESRLFFEAAAPNNIIEVGKRKVKLRDILTRTQQFTDKASKGLEIVSVRPRDDIEVNLDTLRIVSGVSVRAEFTDGVLAGQPKIEPDTVAVRLPSTTTLPADLVLHTEDISLKNEPSGEPTSRPVKVKPPTADAAVLPREVKVTYTVLPPTRTQELTVTIGVQSPREWAQDDTWNQYKLEVQDVQQWTRKIRIKGTRADLEKLDVNQIKAYIVLTEADKQPVGSWLPGKVQVQFPTPAVGLADKVEDVNYRLAKRVEPPAATGG